MTSKKPDWGDYPVVEGVLPPRVEVWEAVALSLDLDPKSLELDFSFGDDEVFGTFPDESTEKAFLRRLAQTQQSVFDERWFTDVQTSSRSKHYRSVFLPQFAALAVRLWPNKIPQELARLARQAPERADTPAVLTQDHPSRIALPDAQPARARIAGGASDLTREPRTNPVVVNSTKGTRSRVLSHEISMARQRCADPDNERMVYAELEKMADEEEGVLRASTEQGIKYRDGSEDRYLTLNALRGRLNRARSRG